MRVAMICSLVLFAAATMNASHPAAAAAAAAASAAADSKTYILLLKPRRDGVVTNDAARLEWYAAYLPDEFTALGEPRIILTHNYLFDGFVARLTDDELQAMSRKPGFGRSFPAQKLYPQNGKILNE